MDRYANILAMLGLLNSVIDVLKIDVEGSEVAFFGDVFATTPNLLKNVKMIAMEIHLNPNLKGSVPACGGPSCSARRRMQIAVCLLAHLKLSLLTHHSN